MPVARATKIVGKVMNIFIIWERSGNTLSASLLGSSTVEEAQKLIAEAGGDDRVIGMVSPMLTPAAEALSHLAHLNLSSLDDDDCIGKVVEGLVLSSYKLGYLAGSKDVQKAKASAGSSRQEFCL